MMELILLVCLILLSALFSMSETAMTTVSRHRIAHLAEQKRPGARLLKRLRADPGKLLSTVLVGNNIVNISASVLTTTVVTSYFEKQGMVGEGVVIGSAIGFLTLVILVFGEITPKTVAIKNAETLALWLAPVMLVLEWLLMPIAMIMTTISRPFVILFGGGTKEPATLVTEEMIKSLLFAGEQEGTIERDEREMISSVFKFGDLTVTQVMTPRDKIEHVETMETVDEVIVRIKASGHSRLPVIDLNLDNVVGVIYAKDLLTVAGSELARDHLRPVLFIPGVKRISDLLDQMQAEYKHLAIVVDEFGHTLGVVTLEDLVEEIVGEIHDEYERRK
ncbi:MAG: hemolysin family protein [Candidatus Margulisiibacteriota bacterium]